MDKDYIFLYEEIKNIIYKEYSRFQSYFYYEFKQNGKGYFELKILAMSF